MMQYFPRHGGNTLLPIAHAALYRVFTLVIPQVEHHAPAVEIKADFLQVVKVGVLLPHVVALAVYLSFKRGAKSDSGGINRKRAYFFLQFTLAHSKSILRLRSNAFLETVNYGTLVE